jgi:hypothetical protein
MFIRNQTLEPVNRDHLAAELQRLSVVRLDAADVDRVYRAVIVHRAELYGAERLDANETAVLTQQLEYLRGRTADIKRPDFKARRLVPVTSEVDPGAESWAYFQWDRAGMAKIIANYADDIPTAQVSAKKFTASIETLALAYDWSWLDMQRTARAGIPLRARKAQSVRDGFEQRIEEIAAIGITDTGATGLLNNANVPQINAAAAAAGANAPAWDGADKTAQEILDDLHAAEDAILTATKGVHAPDTLILPLSHLRILQKRPLSTAGGADPKDTILKVFLEKSENVRNVEWWHYADTVDAGAQRACMYKRDPTIVHLEIPLEQQEQPPQVKNLTMEVISVGRIGGVVFEYPLAAVYIDAI